MFQDYLKALSLILFAEMGDKTQIIAMTFATRYAVKDILAGVALGAGLNHAIAIILGTMLTKFINVDILQGVAGLVFVTFAMLSLGTEDEDDEDEKRKQFSPILTVAFAFFMGELGDKTQISALTLSLDSSHPLFILLGTTSGMVLTSLVGIIVGSKLGKKIPEFQLKVAAFLIFLGFGLERLISSPYFNRFGMIPGYLLIGGIVAYGGYRFYRFYQFEKGTPETSLREHAEELYEVKHNILKNLDKLCLNDNRCSECIGDNCIINFMRRATKEAVKNPESFKIDTLKEIDELIVHNSHSREVAEEMLRDIELYLEKFPQEKDNLYIIYMKKSAEKIISSKLKK